MTERELLIARYEKLSARAAIIETSLDNLALNPYDSIALDTAEGKQSTKYQSPETMQAWLDKIYSQMEYIARRLGSGMLVTLNVRRQQYSNYFISE